MGPKKDYFYPRPPRGGRHGPCKDALDKLEFLSTPSARRATLAAFRLPAQTSYFYPRPPRGGRPSTTRMVSANPIFLSTPSARRATSLWHISMALPFSFLSTPSARRATYTACVWLCQFDISIHALREEGDLPQWSLNRLFIFYFYPRPPRGGRRLFPVTSLYFFSFLSTPSARRATTR